jgi:hypothetical protein
MSDMEIENMKATIVRPPQGWPRCIRFPSVQIVLGIRAKRKIPSDEQ